MTLWILFCAMTPAVDTLFMFYAKDKKQADCTAQEILKRYPYEFQQLKEYPYGFTMFGGCHISGTQEQD